MYLCPTPSHGKWAPARGGASQGYFVRGGQGWTRWLGWSPTRSHPRPSLRSQAPGAEDPSPFSRFLSSPSFLPGDRGGSPWSPACRPLCWAFAATSTLRGGQAAGRQLQRKQDGQTDGSGKRGVTWETGYEKGKNPSLQGCGSSGNPFATCRDPGSARESQ